MELRRERFEKNRQRARAPGPAGNQPRLETVLDLPPEKEASKEDAAVSGPEQRADPQPAGGAPSSSAAGGTRAAGGRQLSLPRTKKLNAHQLLQKMGLEFLDQYKRNTAAAWENLLLTLVSNLDTLAISELVGPVRDLINVAKDVEDQVRKGQTLEAKQLDGDRRLPMDAIGAQWRLELPSARSPTAPAQKRMSDSGIASSKKKRDAGSGMVPATTKGTESSIFQDGKIGESTD